MKLKKNVYFLLSMLFLLSIVGNATARNFWFEPESNAAEYMYWIEDWNTGALVERDFNRDDRPSNYLGSFGTYTDDYMTGGAGNIRNGANDYSKGASAMADFEGYSIDPMGDLMLTGKSISNVHTSFSKTFKVVAPGHAEIAFSLDGSLMTYGNAVAGYSMAINSLSNGNLLFSNEYEDVSSEEGIISLNDILQFDFSQNQVGDEFILDFGLDLWAEAYSDYSFGEDYGEPVSFSQNSGIASAELDSMQIDSISGGIVPTSGDQLNNIAPVPIPGAVWLLSSGVIGLMGFRRKMISR